MGILVKPIRIKNGGYNETHSTTPKGTTMSKFKAPAVTLKSAQQIATLILVGTFVADVATKTYNNVKTPKKD